MCFVFDRHGFARPSSTPSRVSYMPDWAKWPTLKIDEHGGVSEGGSEMSKIGGSDSKNSLYCSFCGKSQNEVRHRAERTIAERLTRLANGKLPWPWIDPDKALPWVEGRIGLALAESQVAAIRLALMSKVLVMTGGPGVGKTTIVNAILRILAAKG